VAPGGPEGRTGRAGRKAQKAVLSLHHYGQPSCKPAGKQVPKPGWKRMEGQSACPQPRPLCGPAQTPSAQSSPVISCLSQLLLQLQYLRPLLVPGLSGLPAAPGPAQSRLEVLAEPMVAPDCCPLFPGSGWYCSRFCAVSCSPCRSQPGCHSTLRAAHPSEPPSWLSPPVSLGLLPGIPPCELLSNPSAHILSQSLPLGSPT
jgi:hypothetical protein